MTDENGLTKKDRDNLLTIRRMYKGKWAILQRARIRSVLKKMEYRRSVGVCEAALQQLAPSPQYLATIG